jgi:hypothetical protein
VRLGCVQAPYQPAAPARAIAYGATSLAGNTRTILARSAHGPGTSFGCSAVVDEGGRVPYYLTGDRHSPKGSQRGTTRDPSMSPFRPTVLSIVGGRQGLRPKHINPHCSPLRLTDLSPPDLTPCRRVIWNLRVCLRAGIWTSKIGFSPKMRDHHLLRRLLSHAAGVRRRQFSAVCDRFGRRRRLLVSGTDASNQRSSRVRLWVNHHPG